MKDKLIQVRTTQEKKNEIYRASNGNMSKWIMKLISAELNKK
jgi:hypothetical protein